MSFVSSAVSKLSTELGADWQTISKAQSDATKVKAKLKEILDRFDSQDVSIVVFGSLAREEWTSKSDLDWTLLIDGEADPEHFYVTQEISKCLEDADYREPGATGPFGRMAFSHDIIHRIGGQDDTNLNITQRILLLLESWCVGKTEAYDRVVRQVLTRYIEEDDGLRQKDDPKKLPRFLLNDIVRYWRTMAVDFAYKKREHGDVGWALRNAKLRMSRKLLFVSGLLICFNSNRGRLHKLLSADASNSQIVAHLQETMRRTPLEIVADSMTLYKISKETIMKVFASYDAFLDLLNDEDKRRHLKELPETDASSDSVFNEVRDIGHKFQEALTKVFFEENPELTEYTQTYGVF